MFISKDICYWLLFCTKIYFPGAIILAYTFVLKNLQAILVVVMQFIKGRYVENVIISYVLTEQNIMKTCNLSTFTATIFSQSHPESQQLCALYVRGSPGQESIYGGFFCFVIFWFLFFWFLSFLSFFKLFHYVPSLEFEIHIIYI